MPLRYTVLETYAENSHVHIQYLGNFQSASAAYWHFPPDFSSRLRLIDFERSHVHDWFYCQRLMCYEQLLRIQKEQRTDPNIMQCLVALGYVEYEVITVKGHELIAEFTRPVIRLELGHIKNENKLHLK